MSYSDLVCGPIRPYIYFDVASGILDAFNALLQILHLIVQRTSGRVKPMRPPGANIYVHVMHAHSLSAGIGKY